MGEKRKDLKQLWTIEPAEEDFGAAREYLSLLTGPDSVRLVVNALRAAEATPRKARDLLRASRLPLLDKDHPSVASDLKKIKQGKPLSPVLVLRGDWERHARPMEIADGYHRICASLLVDEEAEVPCRCVDPWTN